MAPIEAKGNSGDPSHKNYPPPAPGSALRDIALGLLELTRELGHDVRVRTIVADTNIILKDLSYSCRTGKQTALLSEAKGGLARIIVTPHVVEEVSAKIPVFAKNVRLEPSLMVEKWSEYKPFLFVISPPASKSDAVLGLSKRDPSDVPTAELIELVSPDLSLSDDKDLRDLGFSHTGDWLPVVLSTSKSIEHDALSIVIKTSGAIMIVGLSEVAAGLYRALVSAVRRIPKEVWLGLLAALAIVLLVPKSREWIVAKVNDLLAKGEKAWANMETTLQESLLPKMEEWRKAELFLAEHKSPMRQAPVSLQGYAIRVLSQSPYPLDPKEILIQAQAMGYRPRGPGSQKYLASILRRNGSFQRLAGDKWSLRTVSDIT